MSLTSRWAAAILAALVITGSADFATAGKDLQVGDKLQVFDGPGTLGGGIFEIKPLGTSVFDTFRTFCLQRTESIDYSSKGFKVDSINTYTIGGYDELSPKTAWVYSEYRKGAAGILDELGFKFTGTTSQKDNSANALQALIWHFEEEPGYGNLSSLPSAYKNLAIAMKNAAVAAGWTNLGYVRVANLVYAESRGGHKRGDRAQDILILVPEPASIVFWLSSSAMAGLVVMRQRRKSLQAT